MHRKSLQPLVVDEDSASSGPGGSSADAPSNASSGFLEALGFVDIDEPDSDGLFKGLILPPAHYTLLFRSSFQGFIGFFLAVARGYFDICWYPLLVTLTSLNYWRRPDHSWRRYADMAAIQCMYYQMWRAYGGAQYWAANFALVVLAGAFFFAGVRMFSVKRYWASTLLHFAAHCTSNLSNIVLYSGHVPPTP